MIALVAGAVPGSAGLDAALRAAVHASPHVISGQVAVPETGMPAVPVRRPDVPGPAAPEHKQFLIALEHLGRFQRAGQEAERTARTDAHSLAIVFGATV